MREDVVKRLALSFFVGGCFGAACQGVAALCSSLLGPDSPWVMASMLVVLGIVGAVLYAMGVYQRLERCACMGVVMPLSGLVSAVAGAYLEGRGNGGNRRGIAAGVKFFLYVLGVGACLSAAVGFLVALA